jgi:signal transduction histidine kinase
MSRISWWLPVSASAAAVVMAALALMAMRAGVARHDLAIEGRILGIAHQAEAELREAGIDSAETVLRDLLEQFAQDIQGLVLHDSAGAPMASVGRVELEAPLRSVDLYLGRFAAADRGSRGSGGPRGFGRGRARLDVAVSPEVLKAPLATRLVFPFAVVVGAILVGLAVLEARMVERNRQLEVEAVDRRRLEGLARAGAGLAHQLRTPLATIKGSCQLLEEDLRESRASKRLRTAIAEAERMERTLRMLLDYARPPQPQPVSSKVTEVVDSLVGRWPRISLEIGPDAVVFADPDHLHEMLANLIENAVQAGPPDSEVRIAASSCGRWCTIEVQDHGPGPGEDPEELFEPYVTSKADGTGLGLPIARTLAEVNGGTIELFATAGGGGTVRVRLPAGEV